MLFFQLSILPPLKIQCGTLQIQLKLSETLQIILLLLHIYLSFHALMYDSAKPYRGTTRPRRHHRCTVMKHKPRVRVRFSHSNQRNKECVKANARAKKPIKDETVFENTVRTVPSFPKKPVLSLEELTLHGQQNSELRSAILGSCASSIYTPLYNSSHTEDDLNASPPASLLIESPGPTIDINPLSVSPNLPICKDRKSLAPSKLQKICNLFAGRKKHPKTALKSESENFTLRKETIALEPATENVHNILQEQIFYSASPPKLTVAKCVSIMERSEREKINLNHRRVYSEDGNGSSHGSVGATEVAPSTSNPDVTRRGHPPERNIRTLSRQILT